MFKLALVATIFSASFFGNALADENVAKATARLDELAKIFKENGVEVTFNKIDGLGGGGKGTASDGGKGREPINTPDESSVINSDDPDSFIFCVADGKWAAYPSNPIKIGKDAFSDLKDANGNSVVKQLINALKGKDKAVIDVKMLHPGTLSTTSSQGAVVSRSFLAYHSKTLLGKKNDSGKKFFCAVSYKTPR
jgi:hypothetical protein